MNAIIWTKYGNEEVLELREVPIPKMGTNDILVKVKAASVNRTDCAMLTARMFIMRLQTGLFGPKIPVLGTEFSGIVEKVGEGVTQYQEGDKVFGFNDEGVQAQAEFLVISENKPMAKMPENITFIEAATSLEGAHYGINFINKVPIKQGSKILVNGGTGGIGSAIIQLLKNKDVTITATCRSEHFSIIESLGAHKVIDYTTDDFTLLEEKFDYVFDAVGKSSFSRCKPIMKPKATYISSELGPHFENPFLAIISPVVNGKRVKFPLPLNKKASVKLMRDLLYRGDFKPLIDRTYPLAKTAEAYNYVLQGLKVGNVGIEIDGSELP
jgi:NADPH:quinone reductase-like Zn-dependent oxidoreductase